VLTDLLLTGSQDIKNIHIKKMETLTPGLYIITTPIGNLEDITLRAKNTLENVDLIICENPTHSLKLLNNLGIKKKLISMHDYNEHNLIKRIEKIQEKTSIGLISDAGAPLISDPGYNLTLDYIKKNMLVTSIPGPSSVITALQLSGIPINNFEFFGFVPKGGAQIQKLIKKIKNSESTSVLFISGKKLINFLNYLLENQIKREVAICKEMTKKNENVYRGSLQETIKSVSLDPKNLKGEFVLVIDKNKTSVGPEIKEEVKLQISKILNKFTLTETVEIVHKLTNVSKNKVYQYALLLKND
tara:strand:+ start:1786 stop:2688 length:903 start_codon:yes stop_codon:yes gene_type:complete